MKKLILLSLAALTCAVPAAATVRVDIYADQNHSICQLYDNVQPPVVLVYYFLSGATGASGVAFTATKPACWTGATFAGDSWIGVPIGNTQNGVSMGFGGCIQGTVYLGKTAYLVSGTGTPCCQITVMPGTWEFVYTDCTFAEYPIAAGQKVTINPDASCPCQLPVATEPSTWGRVKSLYH